MPREIIHTKHAPEAIGTYSQAVKHDNTVYISGQIPLDPTTMALVSDNADEQITQVFNNLLAICNEAGGSLADIIKLNIYLTDLGEFPQVNEIMAKFFQEPYPARAALGVSQLPKGAQVEMDAIMILHDC
jgi:reactive intermediate/imine deaminase